MWIKAPACRQTNLTTVRRRTRNCGNSHIKYGSGPRFCWCGGSSNTQTIASREASAKWKPEYRIICSGLSGSLSFPIIKWLRLWNHQVRRCRMNGGVSPEAPGGFGASFLPSLAFLNQRGGCLPSARIFSCLRRPLVVVIVRSRRDRQVFAAD